MTDAADTYVETLGRLQAGEPLALIPTQDLSVAASVVGVDVRERHGRLSRFPDARQALERVASLSEADRMRRVQEASAREHRGEALCVDDEAVLALNASHMHEVLLADLARRNSSSH